mgnify:CR=1 FL=1
MRRFFVKNILFVIAVNVLVKPVWAFFIDRTVQNRALPGTYGTYQALLSVSIIFQTILDFGLSSYNSRMVAQNPDKLPELFPAMLSARLVLMLIYMLLACTWGYAIGYRGWELHLLIGVLLIQSLNALVSFIRSNIAALHKFKTDGILSVTDRLLMIASDRLSAFDVVMGEPIPGKGALLTEMALFWFERLKGIVPKLRVRALRNALAALGAGWQRRSARRGLGPVGPWLAALASGATTTRWTVYATVIAQVELGRDLGAVGIAHVGQTHRAQQRVGDGVA